MARRFACVLVAFGLSYAAFAGEVTTDPPNGVSVSKLDGNNVEITIDWNAALAGKAGVKASGVRITSDSNITLRVTHFNFLSYKIDYKVDEKTIEAYQLLEKYWSVILGGLPGGALGIAGPTDPFEKALVDWRKGLISERNELKKAIDSYTAKVALTDAEVSEIKAHATELKTLVVEIEKIRLIAWEAIGDSSQHLTAYLAVEPEHDKINAALGAYMTQAAVVENGDTKAIGKKKAGTIITVTCTPASTETATSNAGKPQSVEYFVQSRFPLVFHVGYAHSKLDDVDFKQVRALSGADLFSKVESNDGTDALTAFLSYEFVRWGKEGRYGALASLGTDFEKPGTRLYAGLSVKLVKRIVLSAGVSSAKVEEGQDPTSEPTGSSQDRELFGSITKKRDYKVFYGISFRVF